MSDVLPWNINSEENLWSALICLQGQPFYTARGLQFTYTIHGNEMFVDRKSKSITRATVELAYHQARELGNEVTGPKMLGCFGSSYLYPVFCHLGVVPQKTTKKHLASRDR